MLDFVDLKPRDGFRKVFPQSLVLQAVLNLKWQESNEQKVNIVMDMKLCQKALLQGLQTLLVLL